MGEPPACVFCGVLRGDPADLVIDEPEIAAFLDHRPLFHGHVLVVPRAHVETLPELPVPLLAPLFERVRALAAAMPGALGCDGTLVAVNNRVSQSVPHLHVHVIPRRRGDGLKGFFWPRRPYASDEERRAVVRRLREALAAP